MGLCLSSGVDLVVHGRRTLLDLHGHSLTAEGKLELPWSPQPSRAGLDRKAGLTLKPTPGALTIPMT